MSFLAGTGLSRAERAEDAGREAALAAVGALKGEAPALVIVFTTPRYDLPALLAAIRGVTGDAPLVGATGSGEFVRGEFMGFGAGVVVLVLSAGRYRFGVASAGAIKGDLDRAGQELARSSRSRAGASPHAAVLLLADALLGDLQQLVLGIYRITGPRVGIVGGAAGDEQKFIATFVFHDDRVVEQGAVAVWIASEHPIPIVTRHGWQPIGIPMLVTRAAGTQLIEIAGRPAAAAYEEQLGLAPGQLGVADFWGTSITHPFGLLQADGDTVIRVARSKTAEGVLNIQGCVPPEGSAVQVMRGDADSLLAVVPEVARTALAAAAAPGVLIAFSCAARMGVCQARIAEEPQALQAAAGDIPSFGIYCCGEFARTSGVLGTHNATLTALVL
ncbi:MAG: FIST C-terminal domain-containing protein [Sterolibacteriaceae bacterium MAG5]|nr:FIST C-terminal domain-containing protein [Candidatus Nitricoxidireducens bremensis]